MPERSAAAIGWGFVTVQAVLLVSLAFVGGGDDWPTPWPVELAGWALALSGVVVGLAAFRSLGSALTPTPEPRDGDRLRRDGPYAHVRHPIYAAVLLIVVGWVVRSGSWAALAIGLVTLAFFQVKSRWEERRLALRYPEYRSYANEVPRFVPRLLPRIATESRDGDRPSANGT